MSVIAIKKTATGFELAGDAQTTWGKNKIPKQSMTDKQITSSGKIFQVNGMTFGCSGSVSHIGLLLIYAKTHNPKEMDRDEILNWFIEFREWVTKKAGITYNDLSIHAIIVRDGKAFTFYDFVDVQEVNDFDAVGSGMWLAIGAMETGASAEVAAKVAAKYDLYCGGDINVINI
jgi:ATP-dependent protease HslVU (ClpYQ) peptidase subunit